MKPSYCELKHMVCRAASFLSQPGALILLAWVVVCGAAALYPSGREAALAQQDLRAGKPGEAAGHLARAAEMRPWRDGWWEAAGRLALAGGDPQAAARWLETGRRRAGLSAAGLSDLGEAYRQTGRLAAALQAWEAAEAQGIPVESLAASRLVVHRASGDWNGMAGDLEVLARVKPEEADIQYELGLILATREPPAALPYLAQAGELDPERKASASLLAGAIRAALTAGDPAYTLLGAGRALASLSEWALAAEAFHQATTARPDYAEAWAFLGEARQHLGGEAPGRKSPAGCGQGEQVTGSALRNSAQEPGDPALAELQRAVAADPESLAAQLFLSLYWQRQNCPDLAVEAAQAAVRLAPGNPAVQVELGNAWGLAGNLAGAQEAFETAVKLAPTDPTYWRALAIFTLKYDVQVQKVGLPAARSAVRLAPQHPAGLDTLAQVFLRLEDEENARRCLQQALQIQEDYSPAHLHLGWLYLLQGDQQKAFVQFQQTLSLDPGSPAAAQAARALENYFP